MSDELKFALTLSSSIVALYVAVGGAVALFIHGGGWFIAGGVACVWLILFLIGLGIAHIG